MAAHKDAFMLLFTRQSGDREFYQAKTVKTRSNNLIMLAHVQLKPFYRLSTRDVTHVRKYITLYRTASDRKLSGGLETRLRLCSTKFDEGLGDLIGCGMLGSAQGQEHRMCHFFIMHAIRNVIHSYTCVDVFWCLE